ncbi:MAG: NfeD family protein [Firmicutes bacterium]|mgnify:FL=1|nr:NfeD family protein [Bacillota bacterium]
MTVFGINVSMIVIWLAVALVMLVIEALTVGLATIWFAAGALVALLAALLDFSIAVQIVLFLAVSICLLVFTRKIFVEKLKAGSEKTNVDALVGEKGVVISPIHPYEVGQVKVGGQVWSAVGKNPDETFAVDQLVKINAIEGVKLVVTPVKHD